jgi:hypothetical protein
LRATGNGGFFFAKPRVARPTAGCSILCQQKVSSIRPEFEAILTFKDCVPHRAAELRVAPFLESQNAWGESGDGLTNHGPSTKEARLSEPVERRGDRLYRRVSKRADGWESFNDKPRLRPQSRR